MIKFNYLLLLLLSLSIFSCGSNSEKKTALFAIKTEENKTEFQLGEIITASIDNLKNREIDSVKLYFGKHFIKTLRQGTSFSLQLEDQKLGKHPLQAVVFSEGEKDTTTTSVKIYSNTPPVSYTYKVINAYPHDPGAYTQGLEFARDSLYESTGQYGKSSLRKLDLETGNVLKKIDLEDDFFGEGLTILDDKIYQLTWNKGKGFIYDLDDFEKTGSFDYNQSEEGWGLCNDGDKIYKSDGTEKIWILNADTLAEEDFIQVTTHKNIVSKMNELEWVEGKIYANTYQKDGVAIINPKNGAIEGLIDFRGLRDQVTQHDELDVLNGIAYNQKTQKLYVTGKNWDKIFEVEIQEK